MLAHIEIDYDISKLAYFLVSAERDRIEVCTAPDSPLILPKDKLEGVNVRLSMDNLDLHYVGVDVEVDYSNPAHCCVVFINGVKPRIREM